MLLAAPELFECEDFYLENKTLDNFDLTVYEELKKDEKSFEIKAVELTKGADGKFVVSSSASVKLKEGVISEGIVTDGPLFMAALNDLFDQGKIKKDSLSKFLKSFFLINLTWNRMLK